MRSVNVSPDTFVVVRIWLAKVNGVEAPILDVLSARQDINANTCVGHISLQLVKNKGNDTRYASYWPSRTVGPEEIVPGEFYTLSRDIALQGMPDKTFILFSLDNAVLWNAMDPDQLKQRFPHYTLIDGSVLRKKVTKKISFWGGGSLKQDPALSSAVPDDKKPVSCSGMVYDLVTQSGCYGLGFQYLKLTYNITRDLVVTTPNNLVGLFLEAEKNERRFWSATVGYKEDAIFALSQKLLSTTQLSEFDDLYRSVSDLLKWSQSIKLEQVFEHRKKLMSPATVLPSVSSLVLRNDVLPAPQIRMPKASFGPLFPLLQQASAHPKTCGMILLLFSYLLGRYSEEISGILKPIAYLTILVVAGVFLFDSLSKSNQYNRVNMNAKRDHEDNDHEETQSGTQPAF